MVDEAPKPKGEPEYRIDGGDMAPVFLMAGLFDLISIFPLPIGAVVGQFVMTVVWFLKGINPMGKKYWVWYLVTWFIEFIPLVSVLPFFVLSASRMIAISRIEDFMKQKGIDQEKGKQFVRVAKGRLYKEQIRGLKEQATWEAGAKRDKQGNVTGYDTDKMQKKTDDMKRKEADLDKALKPDKNLLNRQPGFRQKQQPANDNTKPVDGVIPDAEAA